MTKKFLILGLAPMLALGACGGTTETAAVDNGMMTENVMMADGAMGGAMTDNAMMADAAASPAQQFANTAAASDYYEVEAGKLAQTKATAQGLKDFGGMMVEQHNASTQKLQAAAARATPAIVPVPTLNAQQETDLAALRAAEGEAFDAAYKAQQLAAHQVTLAAMTDYAANGEVPELKTFASEAQKVVQTHLDRLQAM